ncbi:aldehyde dehydrogenase family protein [Kordiimonas pumila]|uniref:Aldehyde dehydrogenase family protein n=1 Tax=Kordiimonas pumila TaxID=2161677 RepID=A0ABV7D5V5_9PROT|nr:aldehyde dehydrogenase family protein [Kordiimonas pumila]
MHNNVISDIKDQRTLTSAATQSFLSKPLKMLIGGAWEDSVSGDCLDVVDPASGISLNAVPKGNAADIDRAVLSARKAFEGAWKQTLPVHREKLLLKLADLLEQKADEFAELETLDAGKLLTMSRYGDVEIAINSIRYMAGWATKIEGTTISPSFPYVPGVRFSASTRREPIGVVGQIIPWNFPLVMAVWKIAPALAAGCTVVLKPAEDTPLSALRLGELIMEAGFPEGVVNIVTGGGDVGAALVEHPDVDKIAFTGSTEVGQEIQRRAAKTMKRLSLELGGKSPVIILKDADIASAVRGAAEAVFFNNGQVCTAGSRLFVERPIYDAVLEGLAEVADGFKLGSGFNADTQMGPLISAKQQERVNRYIELGKSEGGRLIAGGNAVEGNGFFVRPTVFADTQSNMAIRREEIFGPVLSASAFDDVSEAIDQANATPYGLGASVWTNNLSLCNQITPAIKAGTVWINCHNLLDPAVPFGGYKMSGYGKELGRSPVDLYTESKSITTALV